jgi:membrane protein implicated in regulation of membrane protease activity
MGYAIEWMLFVAGLVLFALLCAPYLVVIWLAVVLLAAAAALVAVAGAVVAAPYLLARSVRGRRHAWSTRERARHSYAGPATRIR